MKRVYFIRPVGMSGPVKIGCSVRVLDRLSVLSTWSPFPLEVAAEIPGGLDLEMRFHAAFREYHTHKEWFRWSQRLELTIAAIQAGTFDINTLPRGSRLERLNRNYPPERRLRTSYKMRCNHLDRKSGYYAPIGVDEAFDTGRVDLLDAYLADPHAHGIERPYPSSKAAAAAYAARHSGANRKAA